MSRRRDEYARTEAAQKSSNISIPATWICTAKLPSKGRPASLIHAQHMAQIYLEDRGTNYAIRQGCETARKYADWAGAATGTLQKSRLPRGDDS